ncbi:DKNYY domain-containing protein [Emticicia sp. C21]|uniref:DKNYY domain-containing protein n=1 Tax=Emticicia sp. C21 TaxID=2302915 RepID=UPI000E34DBE8|nr:DKNYY domain-containing protein [Emticicia sp. C21]RFS16411.1 hypothetical protein D0T08_12050 [Emticicia sp. C21]
MLKKLFPFSLLGFLFNSCSLEGFKNGYYIESDTVMYYSGFPAHKYLVQGADASTFETINKDYGKDETHVFYREYIVKNADPATFKVLEGFYSKDKSYGFAIGSNGPDAVVIISHEPDFFETVPNPEETPMNHTAEGTIYARDRQHVYDGKYIVALADPATFEYIPMRSGSGYNLAWDKKYVYWRDKPLEGADGGTFEKIANDYFKDAKAIWSTKIDNRGNSSWVILADADMATFKIVDEDRGIAKDKNFHYSNGAAYIPKPPQQAANP